MSTRGLYTFKGESAADSWNIYVHHDNYPSGAAELIEATFAYFAWKLPRYEADEAATSLCAAAKARYFVKAALATSAKARRDQLRYTAVGEHKLQGGGVRMMPQGKPLQVAAKNCGDIQYRYEIFQGNDGALRVRAYGVDAWENPTEKLLTDCALEDFTAWAKAFESEAA